MQQPAYYHVYYGTLGELPLQSYGLYECRSFSTFCSMIRDAMAAYSIPQYRFREIHVRKKWRFIRRYGSSTVHFTLIRFGSGGEAGAELHFAGLTEEEFLRGLPQ